MKYFFKGYRFKALCCIFAFLIGFLIYDFSSGERFTPFEQGFNFVTSPFVKASTSISNWAHGNVDILRNAQRYKKENEQLRKILSEMHSDVLAKEELQQENESLKSLLEIASSHKEYIWGPPCNVSSRTANDLFGSFKIDRGSSSGLSVGNPVFNEIGLIGKVSEIADDYSKVTTIVDPNFKIGVKTIGTDSHKSVIGVIENTAKYSSERKCLMKYIEKDSDIKPGDKVVTFEDSIYPPGIVIGTVSEVFADSSKLTLSAIIIPEADVFNINKAYVILGVKN